jgi:hypothetical protein
VFASGESQTLIATNRVRVSDAQRVVSQGVSIFIFREMYNCTN